MDHSLIFHTTHPDDPLAPRIVEPRADIVFVFARSLGGRYPKNWTPYLVNSDELREMHAWCKINLSAFPKSYPPERAIWFATADDAALFRLWWC